MQVNSIHMTLHIVHDEIKPWIYWDPYDDGMISKSDQNS